MTAAEETIYNTLYAPQSESKTGVTKEEIAYYAACTAGILVIVLFVLGFPTMLVGMFAVLPVVKLIGGLLVGAALAFAAIFLAIVAKA